MTQKSRLAEVIHLLQSELGDDKVSSRMLAAVRDALDDYETEVRANELKSRYEAALKIVRELGLESLSELETLVKSGKGGKAAPKNKLKGTPLYRNSVDPSLTWTGRGRKPGWVQTFLDNGGKLEELRISA